MQRESTVLKRNILSEDASLKSWLGPDIIGGTATALAITPVILTIDKAVCDASVKRFSMSTSLKMGVTQLVTQPHVYASHPAFSFVWGIYIATYSTANMADTYAAQRGIDPFLPKFLAAACVNIPCSVLQDRNFANWFGAGAKTLSLRTNVISLSFWAFRDMSTVMGSFCLPSRVGPMLEEPLGLQPGAAKDVAQIIVPSAAAMFIHPPLHLIGLDMRNRPELAFKDRIPLLKEMMIKTSFMRLSRILPAFGLGGIINAHFRATSRPWFAD